MMDRQAREEVTLGSQGAAKVLSFGASAHMTNAALIEKRLYSNLAMHKVRSDGTQRSTYHLRVAQLLIARFQLYACWTFDVLMLGVPRREVQVLYDLRMNANQVMSSPRRKISSANLSFQRASMFQDSSTHT